MVDRVDPAEPAEATLLLPLPGGEVAVAGLIWRPLAMPNRVTTQTKKLLLQHRCNYFVVHQAGEQAQCGLAASLPGRGRYYSAALLLLERLGSDWLAVFAWQAGRYLLIGAKASQIIPGCDVVLASAAAVTQHFENYQALVNWQTIYAPADLNLGSSEALELAPLLKECSLPRAYRLHYFYGTPKNTRRLLVGCGLTLSLLALTYAGWRFQQHQQAVICLAQQRLLQAREQYKHLQLAADTPSPEPWRQHPAAAELLRQCVDTVMHYPLLLGGWQIVATHCSSQGAQAEYQCITPGSPQDFIAAVTHRYADRYQLNSLTTAQVNQPIVTAPRPPTEQPKPLLPFVSAILRKIEGGTFRGQIDDIVAKPNHYAHFELTSASSPLLLLHDIPLDGMVIHTLSSTVSHEGVLTWKISGTVYGP